MIEARTGKIESDTGDFGMALHDTIKGIDYLRVELKTEIDMNTHRIDETSNRIDELYGRFFGARREPIKAL